ncbi:MAG TPA: bpX6 domain-containing protein, partial [Polyangiaceae bacterium]|nr:bpX6 domain-containing protein [Polyangiaceae bacterium]
MKPRFTSHHGTVMARGFWLTHERERRALELWRPGAELYALDDAFILVFPAVQPVDSQQSPGVPLVELDRVLSSAPLNPRERAALPDRTELVLVSAGVARALRRSELTKVDPAELIDVAAFDVRPATSLGELGSPPLKISEATPSSTLFDERTGRSAQQREKAARLVESLQVAGSKPSRPSLFQRIRAWFSRRPGAAAAASGSQAIQHVPRGPSLWQRLDAVFSRWLASTSLMRFLGAKQVEYLRELFDALERRDDLEVLRRAIPLGGEASGDERPALTPPTLRTRFEISPLSHGGAAHSLISVGDIYDDLRRAYEAMFKRLDEAGKHEEAAFLLAEILNEAERAVAYLERHGKLELAAELAEGRNLPAGLVVRQWFLAGNRQRAITIAVRENAFDDAIARLERAGQHEPANALRLLQAERLADAGRYVAAARLVQKLEHARSLALCWLTLAREGGELSGLALELSLAPSNFALVHGALEPLLREDSDSDSDATRQRVTLAEDFARLDPRGGRPLAQLLGREIVADAARSGSASLIASARKIADYVGDAFRADLPGLTGFAEFSPRKPHLHWYAPTDTGTRHLHEAATEGRHIADALGEAGVALIDRNGKQVAHFDQPAEHLVVAHDGLRLLTVARRGGALRVG